MVFLWLFQPKQVSNVIEIDVSWQMKPIAALMLTRL